jgi:hypothetical protein
MHAQRHATPKRFAMHAEAAHHDQGVIARSRSEPPNGEPMSLARCARFEGSPVDGRDSDHVSFHSIPRSPNSWNEWNEME